MGQGECGTPHMCFQQGATVAICGIPVSLVSAVVVSLLGTQKEDWEVRQVNCNCLKAGHIMAECLGISFFFSTSVFSFERLFQLVIQDSSLLGFTSSWFLFRQRYTKVKNPEGSFFNTSHKKKKKFTHSASPA